MNAPLHPTVFRIDTPLELLFANERTRNAYVATSDELEPDNVSDWICVHERIVQLGIERAARERELCRWLLAAQRLAVPRRAGYASLHEYAERTIGLNERQTEERLRVGRALAGLPELDGALARGELCFSAVREMTRLASCAFRRCVR